MPGSYYGWIYESDEYVKGGDIITITRTNLRMPVHLTNGSTADFRTFYDLTQITGGSLPHADKINQTLRDEQEAFLKKLAGYIHDSLDNDGITDVVPVDEMHDYIAYSDLYLDDDILSVCQYEAWYMGGVSNGLFYGYVFDLSTGELLDREELINMGGDAITDTVITKVKEEYPEFQPTDTFRDYCKDRIHYYVDMDGNICFTADAYALELGNFFDIFPIEEFHGLIREGAPTDGSSGGSEDTSDTTPVITGTSASSVRKDSKYTYPSKNVIDGKLNTCWAEGASGYGKGESIRLDLSDSSVVTGFSIWAGYHKSSDLYYKNGRPLTLDLSYVSRDGYSYGEVVTETVTLSDSMVEQTVILSCPAGEYLTIAIGDTAPGSKWADTCISEISLF